MPIHGSEAVCRELFGVFAALIPAVEISARVPAASDSESGVDAGSRNNGDGNGSAAAALPAKAPNLKGAPVLELRVDDIRRPLARTRSNDPAKVQALMDSISEIGLQVPIDVLEVDGLYYGFSGCHRYEAHQRLGLEHIKCRVRKATRATLKMHMM
eukprot:CAMPEP_0177761970 /NCGR_PEP_ID=MMETSP0491_2-20121128/6094_1 /TAXON_ID=63592 /ORGANISM="Tetraselmis chuii, Strain PLY429" /LENGTH=155 /DNA_ID=CAMNT_0019277991 /DNA_START=211 /DNA_END=679 /DNA_ORIENTATION=-